MARVENINPEVLIWARKSAGLSLSEAANRLGIRASASGSAAEKLEKIEAGVTYPTRNQLDKFAAVYRRPLITFYMKEPPRKGERGEDFRTLPGLVSGRENASLDALLRDIRARQEMVKSLLEDEEETRPLPFVGSSSINSGALAIANKIGQALGYAPNDRGRHHRSGNPDDLFRDLRTRTERLGVFVLLVGNLGSYHSAISETVFRGFAIADPIAPFIVINDQDAKSARAFTLIHELAHIWIGQTGVSGTADRIEPATSIGRIEQFCNDVAGEFLLPSFALAQRPADLNEDSKAAAHRVVTALARTWSVSEPMVAYRLSRLGWISNKLHRELASDFASRWNVQKLREKEKAKDDESGPSYYVVKQFKLGNALIDVVRRTLRDNLLTYTKAAKVLGVNPGSVEPLIRNMEKTRGAFIPDMRG